MPPLRPRTKADNDGVLLALDNGVRIESRSPNPGRRAGSYVMVIDPDGYELGYWNAEEWGDDPEQVMGAILSLAASGKAPPRPGKSEPSPPPGVPFVIENGSNIQDTRKLDPLTEVGPKRSGHLQRFEEKDKKK